MPTDLYLIRHGEAVANVTPIIGGMSGDVGLTGRGRAQAELLEERLRNDPIPAATVHASTLPRAMETAQYVARGLQAPVQPDDDLHELRPGAADGLSVEEWRLRYGDPHTATFADPFRPFSPGGESWVEFLARAGGALHRLVTDHADESVVAVTHGGVIEACFYLAFGLGATGNRAEFAPANTGITHWRHEVDANGRWHWTLITFNDSRHLEGAAAMESLRQAVPTPAEG